MVPGRAGYAAVGSGGFDFFDDAGGLSFPDASVGLLLVGVHAVAISSAAIRMML